MLLLSFRIWSELFKFRVSFLNLEWSFRNQSELLNSESDF